MPRHSRGDDDHRRSSPYDSSKERRPHHHKDKGHGSDSKAFKRNDWSQNGEKMEKYYGGRGKNEDYGNVRNRESSRYYKRGGDNERRYRQRSASPSDDVSHSKRTSGFDVAPAGALPNPSGNIGLSYPAMLLMGVEGRRIYANEELVLQ